MQVADACQESISIMVFSMPVSRGMRAQFASAERTQTATVFELQF